jgi:hypothetical protein
MFIDFKILGINLFFVSKQRTNRTFLKFTLANRQEEKDKKYTKIQTSLSTQFHHLRVALNTPLGVLIKNTAAAEEPN